MQDGGGSAATGERGAGTRGVAEAAVGVEEKGVGGEGLEFSL